MSRAASQIAAASAAMVAAAAGCFTYGLLYLLGDKSKAINKALSFYTPSGALSGVFIVGTLVALVFWWVLAKRWSTRPSAAAGAVRIAIALLLMGLLFTFPPFVRFI